MKTPKPPLILSRRLLAAGIRMYHRLGRPDQCEALRAVAMMARGPAAYYAFLERRVNRARTRAHRSLRRVSEGPN